jgi:signal peptidase I
VSTDPAAPDQSKRRRSGRKQLPIWQESLLLFVFALALALLIKTLFVQAFYIPSESMEPGLIQNDRILVEKPSYWFGGNPQRGDVIVFGDPGGWLSPGEDAGPSNPIAKGLEKVGLYPSGGHLVKRVIGVPGDVITCCNALGQIEVNGHALDESGYARPSTLDCNGRTQKHGCYGPMPGVPHWKAGPVPPGKLFVMGDNRDHSADSSYHLCVGADTGCHDSPWVDESLVVGRVISLVWPLGRFSILHRPGDFADVPGPS